MNEGDACSGRWRRFSERRRRIVLGAGVIVAALSCMAAVWSGADGEPHDSDSARRPGGTSSARVCPRTNGGGDPPLTSLETTSEIVSWNLQLLKEAEQELLEHADYSAIFEKQERIDGVLRPMRTFDLLVRHEPFSVRMVTQGDGREVIYISGQNDDKLLVSMGGWKRALGRFKVDPAAASKAMMARRESNYSITEIGLLNLAQRLIRMRERDLQREGGVSCEVVEDEPWDGCSCYRFTYRYLSPEREPDYRKSIAWIERSSRFPVCVQNFVWPGDAADSQYSSESELDEATRSEYFSHRDLRFDIGVTDEMILGARRPIRDSSMVTAEHEP